ncbi:MAG: heat-inducible transcriptional repressor HrcA [Acidobacteriaceae bacterium]|jgi:heat-inducible transcriptional repressor|nr:heat-inducible transcriptional repressor HrcA [Acidobacteriaceae bacterium]
MEPSERSRRVLAALVREYISSGEPVPSSLLVSAAGLGVSSATVRNILSRLEEEGYVQQPHTSAGRIPTDRGYRFYVNLLLESTPSGRTADAVEARLRRDGNALADAVLSRASHVVSQASRNVGFVLQPAHDSAVFDRIEFVLLGGSRVLVVIVASGGHVLQKVIDTGEPLSADELRGAANYLNAELSGIPIQHARAAVIERINEERMLYDALAMRAMELAASSFTDLPRRHVLHVDGTSALFGGDHGLAMSAMHTLILMIEEKQRLVRLLNEYIDGVGLTVVIGAEHLDPSLRPFSLVASTYDDGMGTGTIGVIGPTRMHYSRAIAVVHGAATAVTRVLCDPISPNPRELS